MQLMGPATRMPRGRFTPEMLETLPRDRDVMSYSVGVYVRGTIIILKAVLVDGRIEVIFLPAKIARFIRDKIKDSIVRLDIASDTEKEQLFLAAQPDIVESDWDGQGPNATIVAGCEIQAFKDALFLCFLIHQAEDTHKVLRLDPAIARFFVDYVDDAESRGSLLDIEDANPQSDIRQ